MLPSLFFGGGTRSLKTTPYRIRIRTRSRSGFATVHVKQQFSETLQAIGVRSSTLSTLLEGATCIDVRI